MATAQGRRRRHPRRHPRRAVPAHPERWLARRRAHPRGAGAHRGPDRQQQDRTPSGAPPGGQPLPARHRRCRPRHRLPPAPRRPSARRPRPVRPPRRQRPPAHRRGLPPRPGPRGDRLRLRPERRAAHARRRRPRPRPGRLAGRHHSQLADRKGTLSAAVPYGFHHLRAAGIAFRRPAGPACAPTHPAGRGGIRHRPAGFEPSGNCSSERPSAQFNTCQ
ncbi:hypothetical protein SGPA1_31339 [Streptomyces misionensis JCM 4497]